MGDSEWHVVNDVRTKQGYEVKEERPWWRIITLAFELTLSFALMGLAALWAMLYGSEAGAAISRHIGMPIQAPYPWRVIQWPVIVLLLLFSLASL